MSEEANLGPHNNHEKKDSEDIDTLLHQNLKRTVERQVTIYDVEEAKMIQETSFTSNDEVEHLSPEKVKNNHSSSEIDGHKINTVNSSQPSVEEIDDSTEKEQENKQKCQCLFEVFECIIWALRSMGYSTYSFFRRNCSFCCMGKVDLGKREINDEDSDYWDRNLVENDNEDHCTYNLNHDDTNQRKATFHLNEAFDEATTQALKNHSINKSSAGDTKTRHSVDENKTEMKEKNGIEIENSTSNAVEDSASNVCHVKIHHETHGNNNFMEISGRHNTSGGDRDGHDTLGGDNGGHDISGGDKGGQDISGGGGGGHDISGRDNGGCDFASD